MSRFLVLISSLALCVMSTVAQATVTIQNFPGRMIDGNRFVLPVKVFVNGANMTYQACTGFIQAKECQGSNHRRVAGLWWENVGVQRTYWFNQVTRNLEVVYQMPTGNVPVQVQMAFWMRGENTAWSAIYQAR